jgi:nucleoside-diphosphate-sugar epimerase/sugar lactone lactonase YvrE
VNRVLVTGATGFLGYHVVKRLNEQGVRPRVLELPGSDPAPLSRLDVERCPGDLENPQAVRAACVGVDTVLHLAFKVSAGGGDQVAAEMQRVNVEGTRRLLDAAEAAGVDRFVLSASVLGVGVNRDPVALDETADWTEHAFEVRYAVNRRMVEQEALARATGSFAVTSVCPSFTLGPDDPVGAPANALVRSLVLRKLRFAPRVGFSCLDVRDFACGALAAAERGRSGQRYLLSGDNTTTDEFLEQVAAVAGVPVPRLRPPRALLQAAVAVIGWLSRVRGKPAPIDPGVLQLVGHYAWYDTSRARVELDWQPRPLPETLADTVRWVRSQPGSGGRKQNARRRVPILGWWSAAAPRPEIRVAPSVRFDRSTARAIDAVDHSREFAEGLEHFPSALAGFDDAAILPGGTTALVTGADGRIWTVDTTSHEARPLVDPPLMAYGISPAPGDPDHVYFCASRSYGTAPGDGKVGVYRLALADRAVELVVHEVPATDLNAESPVVHADDDPAAPEVRPGDDGPRRPLAVCDNLAVSDDGTRLYFSEPFDYTDASLDDALDEAVALAPNGRLWRHDLATGATRLVAEGFHFVNGVLCDLHPGLDREQSVLVTQTSLFRLTRFHLRGPRAGTAEVVLDGITGMPDGIDRDAAGRIWVALFTERGPLLTWIHAHAWVKPLVLRLPARLLLARTRRTGVLVLDAEGRIPLYAALYRGPLLQSIPSAVPTATGVYLANLSLGGQRGQAGVVRLRWPAQLSPSGEITRSIDEHDRGTAVHADRPGPP